MNDFDVASQTRYGGAPFFVFCDHASNTIPADLKCLGIPEDFLGTHIAWDIGAGALSEAVARSIGATYFACTYSRLIIDPNRDLHSKDSIPKVSDEIPIPGNQMLSEAERRKRIAQYHDPYHQQLGAALDRFSKDHHRPFAVAIHSYTSRLMGAAEDRPWQFGVLWRDDEESARACLQFLERNTNWVLGDNEPYDARVFNYSIDRHISPRRLPHITVEVRQDLVSNKSTIAETAAVLTEMITYVEQTHSTNGETTHDTGTHPRR